MLAFNVAFIMKIDTCRWLESKQIWVKHLAGFGRLQGNVDPLQIMIFFGRQYVCHVFVTGFIFMRPVMCACSC